jgi:hypothetical protein
MTVSLVFESKSFKPPRAALISDEKLFSFLWEKIVNNSAAFTRDRWSHPMSYGPLRGIYTGYRTVIIDAVAGMAILKDMSFSIEHVKLVYVRG